MRFLRRSLVGIFLASLTLALLGLAGRTVFDAVQARLNEEPRSFPQQERVLTVNVVDYRPETLSPDLRVFGQLESRRTLDLRTSVGGTVTEVAEDFVDGGTVEQGDLLLRIDPAEAEATLARARADLSDAEAELRDAERAVTLAEDDLSAAREQADLRAQALTRQQDLSQRGVGTATSVEEADLAASSARASVLSRRQALADAEARVDQARTSLDRMRIGVDEAERTLRDTELHAAFDGTLSEVAVIEGGRVTANELVGQLIDPDRLEVAFRVSTSQYARLLGEDGSLQNAPVTAELDVSGVDLRAEGHISRESAAVSEGQTGRMLYATLERAPGFRPGDFVTVSVSEPPLENVARLPASAVEADDTVLVVGEEQRLRVEPVEMLRTQGDDVIVRADLEGEQVVAERSPLLGAGIKVDPITTGGPEEAQEQLASAEEAASSGETGEMVALDGERRQRLVSFVEDSEMPEEAKTRILGQLEQEEVPAQVVSNLESRMGI